MYIFFQSLALKRGSAIREIWTDIPDPIPFKIYIFNITNPIEVQQGKKPVVQEIGPYYFEYVCDILSIKTFSLSRNVYFS